MSSHPVWTAMRRGASLRCPSCGKGRLFRRYVKVEAQCPACGEDNGRHRVDDAASYFTILLVGHVVIAPTLACEIIWDAPLSLVLAIALPAVALVTLIALPFVKGTLLGVLSATDRRAIAEGIRPSAPPPAS